MLQAAAACTCHMCEIGCWSSTAGTLHSKTQPRPKPWPGWRGGGCACQAERGAEDMMCAHIRLVSRGIMTRQTGRNRCTKKLNPALAVLQLQFKNPAFSSVQTNAPCPIQTLRTLLPTRCGPLSSAFACTTVHHHISRNAGLLAPWLLHLRHTSFPGVRY